MSGSPRVRDLLGEAQKALALRTRLVALGQDPGEVDEALDGLYRDLGQAVVQSVTSGGPLPWLPDALIPLPETVQTDESERFTDEVQGEVRGRFDVEGDESSDFAVEPTLPLFDPGDLPSQEHLPVPDNFLSGGVPPGVDLDDSTPVIPPEREFTAEEPADFLVASLGTFAIERDVDDGSPFALLGSGSPGGRNNTAAPPWRSQVDDLISLLTLPGSFADSDDLAVEASRVQWATTDLETRLSGLPTEVRIALVAMLGARAQLLRSRLDVDVGPRLSIDRLQRYRIDHDLPIMAALLPNPRPERGSWEEDARQWWALLGGSPE